MGVSAQTGFVDPWPGRRGGDRVVEVCSRCAGSGVLPGVLVDAGRCWRCGGTGEVSVLVSSVRARARRQAAREVAAAHRSAQVSQEHDAAVSALVAAWPSFAAAVTGQAGDDAAYAASEAVMYLRQGVLQVDEAIAGYRFAIGEVVTGLRVNRFPGRCEVCQERVAASAGWSARPSG